MAGENVGTMFIPTDLEGTGVETLAQQARAGSRRLRALGAVERAEIIRYLAAGLLNHQQEVQHIIYLPWVFFVSLLNQQSDFLVNGGTKRPIRSRLCMICYGHQLHRIFPLLPSLFQK